MKQKNFFQLSLTIILFCFSQSLLLSCGNSAALNKEAFHSREGIHFYDSSLQNALSLAKSSNKPVFIMVHANWCSVCKKEKSSILPQKELGDLYNPHFVNIAVDFDAEDGKLIRAQYDVSATPTFLYIAADGRLLNKTAGFQGKEDLLTAAKNLKIDGKTVCD